MRKGIGELLDEFEHSRNEGRDRRVGPSDYGSCERQIMYRVRGVKPGTPVQQTRAATMGTLFWKGLGEFIDETHAGQAIVELPVVVPGLERPGAADLWWLVDGALVDVKTVSERAFDRVVKMGAKPEHVGQIETYALGINRNEDARRRRLRQRLGETVPKVRTLVLAYVNRDDGDVHEIEWAYDETSARERVSWLARVEQAIEDGFELPRAEGAQMGAFPCDWCPFWRTCWEIDGDVVPDDYASKFTIEDDQIEDALERYFEQGEIESKAKRLKSEARAQLVGISYDANGYKLSWSGGRTTYVDEIDYDALVVLAVEQGLDVPMRRVAKRSPLTIRPKRTTVPT
jgi:hypothetical protein